MMDEIKPIRFAVELLPQEKFDVYGDYDTGARHTRAALHPKTQATMPYRGNCNDQAVLSFAGFESNGSSKKVTSIACHSPNCSELPSCRLGKQREGYKDDTKITKDPHGTAGLTVNQLIALTGETHV